MIKLTPFEHKIRSTLIAGISHDPAADPFDACIAYSRLSAKVDPERQHFSPPYYKGIGETLGRISQYEAQHHRPLLSALVEHAGDNHSGPGKGFADDLGRKLLGLQIPEGGERAFWQAEVVKVVTFWSNPDHILMLDGMFDEVMGELGKVKRLIRQLQANQSAPSS